MKNTEIVKLKNFFHMFSDETRIKIIISLMESEKNVGEISNELDMSHSAISHQLRVLRQEYVVKVRKEGRECFYSLDDEHVNEIVEKGIIHIRESK